MGTMAQRSAQWAFIHGCSWDGRREELGRVPCQEFGSIKDNTGTQWTEDRTDHPDGV